MRTKLGLLFWLVVHVLLVSPSNRFIQAKRLRQIGVDGQLPVAYSDPTQFDQVKTAASSSRIVVRAVSVGGQYVAFHL